MKFLLLDVFVVLLLMCFLSLFIIIITDLIYIFFSFPSEEYSYYCANIIIMVGLSYYHNNRKLETFNFKHSHQIWGYWKVRGRDSFNFFLLIFSFLTCSKSLFLLFSSNPGHPFAVGLTLEKLLAVIVDDSGKETFVTGGSLDRIQKVPILMLPRILANIIAKLSCIILNSLNFKKVKTTMDAI